MNSTITITYNNSNHEAIEAIRAIRKMEFFKVSRAKPEKPKKNGLDEALEDVRAGRVTEYESVDDLFKKLGIDV